MQIIYRLLNSFNWTVQEKIQCKQINCCKSTGIVCKWETLANSGRQLKLFTITNWMLITQTEKLQPVNNTLEQQTVLFCNIIFPRLNYAG
jgi:hypothetical protein